MLGTMLACVALTLLAVAPASAAPAWLAPVNLSEAGETTARPQVAVDAQGDAVAVWEHSNGIDYVVQASVRPAGGSWQTPVDLSESVPSQLNPRVAVDPGGEAIAVWRLTSGGARVQASVRPAGGSWQTPVDLSEAGKEAGGPDVALNPQGEAIVTWTGSHGGNSIVQASARPAGGSWQTPVELSKVKAGENAGSASVALDSKGDAVAVWERSNESAYVVQASERPAGGSWQTPLDLSGPAAEPTDEQVAIDSQGDAVAVWQFWNGEPHGVQASEMPAGGSWQTPLDISESGMLSLHPSVAVDPGGDAIATWEVDEGAGHFVAQASSMPAGGSWQTPVQLSEAGESAGRASIAFDPHGDAVAVWSASNGAGSIVQASSMPAGGSWQTPVQLSEAGEYALDSTVAVDSHGDAVAVWERFPHNDNQEMDVVQAAEHVAAGPLLNEVSIPTSGVAGQQLSFSVAPLDGWATLGETHWSFGDGTDAGGTSVTHTYAAAGSYHVKLTSADVLGNTTSASGTVTVAPSPTPALSPTPTSTPTGVTPSVTPTSAPPSVADLVQSHRGWREGSRRGGFARKPTAPLGTTFSFALNEQASVSMAFTEQVAGRKVRGECLATTKQNRKEPGCERTVTQGALSFTGHTGTNEVSFQGRISASKMLPSGRYTLLITATNAAGQSSQSRSLSLAIVK